MLWAALYFPELSLDMISHNDGCSNKNQVTDPLPAVATCVVIQQGAQRLLMSCNRAARNLGLRSGLPLKSAYAVCPDLLTIEYDVDQQQQYIEQLSLWALQYSSWVTPVMPNTIMIEIEASLSLFGGLPRMLTTIFNDTRQQGLQMQMGIAPNPSAARLLSQFGITPNSENNNAENDNAGNDERPISDKVAMTDSTSLLKHLGEIPVSCLPLDDFTLKGLRQSGIRHCEQLFDLPASSLARRFGQSCTELVFKLQGKLPDPCPAFQAPERFTHSLDLALEAPDSQALQFPLNRLLSALGGFLRTSDLGVKKLNIILKHHRLPRTVITLGFLEATADHKHLLKIASERLLATSIPAPAIAITIDAESLATVTRNGKDLFNKSQSQAVSIQQTVDLLSARLGTDKAYTLALQQDHRPEKVLERKAAKSNIPSPKTPSRSGDTHSTSWPARPIWLLQEPVLADQSITPRSSAERIENGWWDTDDVRRDYYIAEDDTGAWYWAFTLRQSPDNRQFYIHGYFA